MGKELTQRAPRIQKSQKEARKWMRPLLRTLIAGVFVLGGAGRIGAQGQELRIAAAADLKFAMRELAGEFEKKTESKVDVTYGSSGSFFSQIQNGAPFDLFFSADIEYPRKLEAAGFAEPGTLYQYAVGRIVIWMPAVNEVARNTVCRVVATLARFEVLPKEILNGRSTSIQICSSSCPAVVLRRNPSLG